MHTRLNHTASRLFALTLLVGMLVVMVDHVTAQSIDPKVQIRSERVQYQVDQTIPTTNNVGEGQSANSWDDRFGYGKSAALNNWASMVASDAKGNVYAGGQFTKAGSVQTANRIGFWDGDTWTSMED